jgi:hypothetical protein
MTKRLPPATPPADVTQDELAAAVDEHELEHEANEPRRAGPPGLWCLVGFAPSEEPRPRRRKRLAKPKP